MMTKVRTMIALAMLLCLMPGTFRAQEVNREQLKGLDEQIQEIKGDVLAIAAELNQLEEKLLYPSHTQVAVFLSVPRDENFQLDAVDILLDGEVVASHLYSYKELEALRMGGVQRIFTGNLNRGEHQLQMTYRAASPGGEALEESASYTLRKDIGPCIVDISLTDRTIVFSDR